MPCAAYMPSCMFQVTCSFSVIQANMPVPFPLYALPPTHVCVTWNDKIGCALLWQQSGSDGLGSLGQHACAHLSLWNLSLWAVHLHRLLCLTFILQYYGGIFHTYTLTTAYTSYGLDRQDGHTLHTHAFLHTHTSHTFFAHWQWINITSSH